MNRRAFLGTLIAALGATAIDPKALLWTPQPEATAVVMPSALLTLNQITSEMLREIVRLTGAHDLPMLRNDSKIGYDVDGHILNHQYSVSMACRGDIDRFGLDREQFIKPAAQSLADRVGNAKASGTLPLPNGLPQCCIMRDHRSGLVLRGLMMYQVGDDGWFTPDALGLRFDMLVAN